MAAPDVEVVGVVTGDGEDVTVVEVDFSGDLLLSLAEVTVELVVEVGGLKEAGLCVQAIPPGQYGSKHDAPESPALSRR